MRRKLDRLNRGQLLYERKANVPKEESDAEAAIGYGSIHMFLCFDFDSEDSHPREMTLRDLGFYQNEEPEHPSFKNLFFDASDSEILIAELNAIMQEINELLRKHPDKTKDDCFRLVCPYRWSIDTDRISVAINQEYYHSFTAHGYVKRKLPLTREESIEFIKRDVGEREDDLLSVGDVPDYYESI